MDLYNLLLWQRKLLHANIFWLLFDRFSILACVERFNHMEKPRKKIIIFWHFQVIKLQHSPLCYKSRLSRLETGLACFIVLCCVDFAAAASCTNKRQFCPTQKLWKLHIECFLFARPLPAASRIDYSNTQFIPGSILSSPPPEMKYKAQPLVQRATK